jgi:HIV Tat-specific factor 1
MPEQTPEDTNEEEAPKDQVSLDSYFFYQNRATGQASQHPLTTRQLCRLICPKNQATSIITPETQVLRVSSDGSYTTAAWEVARDVPIVRHCVPLWHYEEHRTSITAGPISCRELSGLFYDAEVVTLQTRVYSPLTNEWKAIQELPELQAALEALLIVEPKRMVSMTGDDANVVDTKDAAEEDKKKELEAFWSSTEHMGPKQHNALSDDDEASYESDQGTRYVKDPRTGNWVHEALAPVTAKRPNSGSSNSNSNNNPPDNKDNTTNPKKKRKKAKFAAKNARCWIYITGLPADTNEEEVAQVFSKAGILDLDPETQRPKIKLYRNKGNKTSPNFGQCKGDASLCYARQESVELAMTLLDETPFRSTGSIIMRVEGAKFEQRGDQFDASQNRVSNEKRKVAKLAAIQARDWDEGEFNGRLTGGRKGLRIIVLKGLFDPATFRQEIDQDEFFVHLEREVRLECEPWGIVEKLTVFSKNPEGVVIVKFAQPGAASEAVKAWEGRKWKDIGSVRASFWDGVTDYTVRDEVKEQHETKQRQEEFGDWLDNQELPEELQLKKE